MLIHCYHVLWVLPSHGSRVQPAMYLQGLPFRRLPFLHMDRKAISQPHRGIAFLGRGFGSVSTRLAHPDLCSVVLACSLAWFVFAL